jgi:hypothetical protein
MTTRNRLLRAIARRLASYGNFIVFPLGSFHRPRIGKIRPGVFTLNQWRLAGTSFGARDA